MAGGAQRGLGHLSTRPPHLACCPGNLVQPRPPPWRPTSRLLRLPSGIWDPRVQLSGTFPPRQTPQGVHPCPWRPSFLSDPSGVPSIRQPKHGRIPCALSLVPPLHPSCKDPCPPCWNPPLRLHRTLPDSGQGWDSDPTSDPSHSPATYRRTPGLARGHLTLTCMHDHPGHCGQAT